MAEFKGQAVRSIRSVHAEILGKHGHILCITVSWGGKRAGLLQGQKTGKRELYIEPWLCVGCCTHISEGIYIARKLQCSANLS